jgi:hypothetical protein
MGQKQDVEITGKPVRGRLEPGAALMQASAI